MVRTYECTRDVLDHARSFHQELHKIYQSLADEAKQARVRMLLDYLSRHEANLEANLADFEAEASNKILDTWFKFVPSETRLREIQQLQLEPEMSIPDIVNVALSLDDCLVSLYRDVAEVSVSLEVKEVFNNLLEQEEQEKHRLARNALMVEDL